MNLCLHFVAGCRNKIPRQKHFKGGGFIRLPTPGYCPSLQVGRDNSNLTTLRSQSRAESNVCTHVYQCSAAPSTSITIQNPLPSEWCHAHGVGIPTLSAIITIVQRHAHRPTPSGHPLFQGSLDGVSFTIKANQHSYAWLLTKVLGIESRSSRLTKRHPTDCAIS